MEDSTFKQGESKKLSKSAFTKEGYIFLGWSTNNSKDVIYNDEEEVSNLTNVYNGVVNLYAVWVKENVTYNVKYNGNGGVGRLPIELNLTEDENHWTFEDGVYKSGNQGKGDTTSTIRSKEFTLTETSIISFDWVSSTEDENYDYLYYLIYKDNDQMPIDGTGVDTKIGGNSSITSENDLVYQTVTKELEAGTYILEFNYQKDSGVDGGLDTGYVKNITCSKSMDNSVHKTGTKSKLSKNIYRKTGYIFKGWSTSLNGNVKYTDEEEVMDLTDEVKTIDLYAVWEKEKYEVNVVVQDGLINGESIKNISYNENGIFNIIPNEEDNIGIATCTNNQKAIFKNNKLVVKNVSNNTTCTLKFLQTVTTLYDDGTLIINEKGKDKRNNETMHGNAINTYSAMDNSNSYVLTSEEQQPWYYENYSIKKVKIGSEINPVSTSFWFAKLSNLDGVNLTNINSSELVNMNSMFDSAGMDTKEFILDLSSFNTSSVTDMGALFSSAGMNSETFNLNLSGWKIMQITDISRIFENAGKGSESFTLNVSNWDTKNLENIENAFSGTGTSATSYNLIGLNTWDVSKVSVMNWVFYDTAQNARELVLDLSNWDTKNVSSMHGMFQGLGKNSTSISLIGLNAWDTSNVKLMGSVFYQTGENAKSFALDLSNWNTDNVTNMSSMFENAGGSSDSFVLTGLNNWNVSKVIDTSFMFSGAGSKSVKFELDLSTWDTSNVLNMKEMFNNAGSNATLWNVKIPSMSGSLTNTTSIFYGKSKDVYADVCAGKSFTLLQ